MSEIFSIVYLSDTVFLANFPYFRHSDTVMKWFMI